MIFGSVCSGIEAASVAWLPRGWQCAFVAEIASFPCAVLRHHYPHIPNHGDLNRFKRWPRATVDVLVGGTPCQSFSIAGFRAGMADPRGNLALTYLACVERYRPRWLVWENVPNVLSVNTGHDFACLLGGVAKLGYGYAWRVLDAQYTGVPQRRRRVFLVGYLGSWTRAAAVLFECESLRGDSLASTAPWEDNTGTLTARARSCSEPNHDRLIAPTLRGEGFDGSGDGGSGGTPLVAETLRRHPYPGSNSTGAMVAGTLTCEHHQSRAEAAWTGRLISATMSAKWRKGTGGPAGDECQNLIAFDPTQIIHPENRSNPRPGDPAPTLSNTMHPPAVAFNVYPSSGQGADLQACETDIAMACTATDARQIDLGTRIAQHAGVRRLMPRECERLMGLPDDYTLVPYRFGKPAKDGPRYEAIGNSIAVPCLDWIGARIELVESVAAELEAA